MEKLSKYYNLAVINPDLSKQWHSIKNENLTPYEVTPNSHKKVYWICEKGHEWKAGIAHRNNGSNCPFCCNQKVCIDNCLATKNPELSKQWHPTKNGKLTPFDVTPNSNKKVWWICEKGHEWEATINNRNNKRNCPYCSGRKVCKDNCLSILNPELSKQWHPTKNGNLTPEQFTCNSGIKVWWICDKGHEWEAEIYSRNNGSGCPYCDGKKTCIDNCLATKNPELSKQWHPIKNGNLTPFDVCPNSNKKVWWICEFGHEWETIVCDRNKGNDCPYCSGRFATKENNFDIKNPELSKQWHPTKNGKLNPFNVTPNSEKKVWWICENGHEWQTTIAHRNNGNGCPYCHSVISGIQLLIYSEIKYFFNESKLEEKINKFNVDIFIPEINLIIEYDGCFYHKNRYIEDINKTNNLINLKYKVLRIREIDKNIKLNKINNWDIIYNYTSKNELFLIKDIFKYILSNFLLNEKLKIKLNNYLNINNFINNIFYKEILNKLPFPQYEKTLEYYCKNNNMQYLLDEWDYEKNGNLTPDKVYTFSHKTVYWKCKKYNHVWLSIIHNRTRGNNCPLCNKNKTINNIEDNHGNNCRKNN